MHYRVIDFETKSRVDLKKAGAYRYAEDPSTDIICLGYETADGVKTWAPGMPYPEEFTDDVIFVAHNAMFEWVIWNMVAVPRYGWPPLPLNRLRCSMASAGYRALPMKLEKAAEVRHLAHQKDMAGNRLLGKVSKPDKKTGEFNDDFELIQRTMDYCAADVLAEKDLWKNIGPLPAPEQKLWFLDQKINRRGVYVDIDAVQAGIEVLAQKTKLLSAELQTITNGEINTAGQVAKIKDWCNERGAKLESLEADVLKYALANNKDMAPEARRVLEIRRGLSLSSLKKLPVLERWRMEDGRVRGLLQYHAADTGRWAGRGPQPQNLPRGKYEISDDAGLQALIDAIMCRDAELLDMIYGDATQALSDAIRPMFCAAPGKVLVAADLSAIEAVVLAVIAGEQWKIEAFRAINSGQKYRGFDDIYCATASGILGRQVSKKEDPAGRQIGKIAELAFGYQGGVGAWRGFEKFSDRTDDEIDEYKDGWREDHTEIVALWYALEAAATTAVLDGKPTETHGIAYEIKDGWLSCRLPSGRRLWYNEPHIQWEPMPWDPDGPERPCLYCKAWRYNAWRTVRLYGGLLTENVVQAVSRDLLAHGMLNCEDAGYPCILTVHDEVVSEPDTIPIDAKGMIECLTDAPSWAHNWPIGATGWVGERYRKD